MLETDTKRRIDTARDILVGKVPDPKSQVEQITIALIYKFMDDMDKESKEMGGKASFFTGEFKRYRWSSIFDPRLGGHEMLNLYAEAIVKLNQNPSIPQLFRDIFKNAYLPYRDPETLKLFLATINEFVYDHSENLGDAFEYLLSVLGSQGDAGQFRTPRHIIDFMVEVIDPQKNEIILDPACGTAGFPISSYKHIMKANTKKTLGDLLTTSERKKLMDNFRGYDISPDMVRLSLVNLYLHGFSQPKIFEYDTLTSDERWNEYANVILANPPFMSPKGGIKPHKRFSVQSNRSEVLFVDYIAEHLTTSGRAAVIVPEGIIFQSGTAYKQLRKSLVKKFLYAVVSLPSGVFLPYAGVKTSILFLDSVLAQKSDSILFIKIENDGFSLGAQRRAIDKNDLPDAVKIIKEFKKELTQRRKGAKDIEGNNYLIVSKEKIAESGEYNLSGDRYRETEPKRKQKWPMVRLGDVCEHITKGTTPTTVGFHYQAEGINFVKVESIDENKNFIHTKFAHIDQKTHEALRRSQLAEGDILFSIAGALGRVAIVNKTILPANTNQALAIIKLKTDKNIDRNYVAIMIGSKVVTDRIGGLKTGVAQQNLSLEQVRNFIIPLPPIEVQQEIVAEIEGYQKIIDGARQVVENWKPHIDVDPDWPMVKLEDVCDVRDGTHDSPKYITEGYPLITSKNLKNGFIDFNDVNFISRKDLDAINKRSKVDDGDILMPMIGTIGNPVIANTSQEYGIKNVALIKFYENSKINNQFLKYVLASIEMQSHFEQQSFGSTQKFIPLGFIRTLLVPLPPLETQRVIVVGIEAEQKAVDGCRELIALYEGKIKAVIERVWVKDIKE